MLYNVQCIANVLKSSYIYVFYDRSIATGSGDLFQAMSLSLGTLSR